MRAALLCTACSLSLLQLNLGRRQGNFTTETPCDGVAATALSCSAEVRTRVMIANRSTAPSVVRLLFADALDRDRLVAVPAGLPVLGGGLDGCIYGARRGSPQLLRPDPEAAGLLGVIQDHLDCAISQPDALTLAAAVAVEVAGGPPLQVTFGRTKGPCKTIIDCAARGTCAPKLQVDLPRILRPPDLRQAFEHLGLDCEKQAALWGVQTLQKAWEPGRAANCTSRACSRPEQWVGALDRTPDRFDNDYFRLLATLPAIAGPGYALGVAHHGGETHAPAIRCCGRHDAERGCVEAAEDLQTKMGGLDEGSASLWCRMDSQASSALFSSAHGNPVLLDLDYVVAQDARLGPALAKFATDETAFFQSFKELFLDVTTRGTHDLYSCVADVCRWDPLIGPVGGFECGGIYFAGDKFHCGVATFEGDRDRCELTGGVAKMGRITCGETVFVCCIDRPCSEWHTGLLHSPL